MKKTYVTPEIEKVAFRYRDQVVVASGTTCTQVWHGQVNSANTSCSHIVAVKDSGF